MKQTLYSKNDLSSLLKLSVSTIDNKMGAGELIIDNSYNSMS